MKYSIVSCFLILAVNCVHAQISNSHQKKLLKVIGTECVKHPAQSSYPFGLHSEDCLIDTSRTCVNDTTGLIFNNEYVLFRDFIHFKKEKEQFSLMKPKVVTVREYEEFKNYVRDSIARVQLIVGLEVDQDALKYIDISRKERMSSSWSIVDSYQSTPFSYFDYSLNWNREVIYDVWLAPIFTDMYVPIEERFRKQRMFDERTFVYNYIQFLPSELGQSDFESKSAYVLNAAKSGTLVQYHIPVGNDVGFWASMANHNDDELGVLSQLYNDTKLESPVIGVLGTQAQAFCNWKQQQLNRELTEKNLPFEVIVTLPTPDQLTDYSAPKSLVLEEQSYSDQWRITKGDFLEFQKYISDSVRIEAIYEALIVDDDANRFIVYHNRYLDEDAYEYVDFDPSRREANRELFPLNFKSKLKKIDWFWMSDSLSYEQKERIRGNGKLEYRYTTKRTIAMANDPKKSISDSSQCDTVNELGFGTGVRLINYLGDYFEEKMVSAELAENALSGDPKSLIPSLTYEQALAFFNWKYPIDKFNPKKDDWKQFVYPSKEQFEMIQRGEEVVIQKHEFPFPTPLFRYVVHVYQQ